jgi:nifR3 family TIM-barrel protein
MNFWQKLKREKSGEPITVLAPMADVTDPAFRFIIAKYGKPDVIWTEFVSADGLFLGGYENLIKDLKFSESERPIVAQFFSSKPEMMEKAARLALELGFDGIDINMGCPDKSIEKQGAGAALIKNPTLAKEIILAAKQGAGGLPVSVKTRLGYSKNELETWLPVLLDVSPALITIHSRTRKEMSLVPAKWEYVKRAVEIRNDLDKNLTEENKTLIFGNGDVLFVSDGLAKCKETGADGVMLGRAIFGNPWLFSSREVRDISIKEKLTVLLEHTKLFEKLCSHKNFAVMKKHYKAYVNGFDGAKELRMKLMDTKDSNEVEQIINNFLDSL